MFLRNWKNADMLPVPKVPKPNDISVLRSISLLAVISKFGCTKILYRQIVNYLSVNGLILKYQ